MKEKIINLLGVRSIITLALTGTLIFGFVVGKVEAKDFLLYVSMVLTFFFSKTEKEQIKNEDNDIKYSYTAQKPKEEGRG